VVGVDVDVEREEVEVESEWVEKFSWLEIKWGSSLAVEGVKVCLVMKVRLLVEREKDGGRCVISLLNEEREGVDWEEVDRVGLIKETVDREEEGKMKLGVKLSSLALETEGLDQEERETEEVFLAIKLDGETGGMYLWSDVRSSSRDREIETGVDREGSLIVCEERVDLRGRGKGRLA
jgi:hypothetical protein